MPRLCINSRNAIITKNISVGILAGGKSLRMGQNKALLKINGKDFLSRLVEEFSADYSVMVSVPKGGGKKIPNNLHELHSTHNLPTETVFVEDELFDKGPLEGLYRLLLSCKTPWLFVCACDMPFVSKRALQYLSEFISSDYDAYVFRDASDSQNIHPLCAIYSKSTAQAAKDCLEKGELKIRDFLSKIRVKFIDFPSGYLDPRILSNINTREEYYKLLFPVVFCISGIKNSGKTRLSEKLIKKFTLEGFKVSAIKHDGHDFEMDQPGTDSDRLKKAGAEVSAIFSKEKYSLNCSGQTQIKDLVDFCSRRSQIILIEGLKNSDYPKVEIVRKGISEQGLCDEKTLICLATDNPHVKTSVEKIDLNDTDAIYDCIKKYFNLTEDFDYETYKN